MLIDYFYNKMENDDLQRIIKLVGDDLEGQFETVPFFTNRYFYIAKQLDNTDDSFYLEYLRQTESFLQVNDNKEELSAECINIVDKAKKTGNFDELLPFYNKVKKSYENVCFSMKTH